MSYQTNISPGSPPLLWSNIDQAFKQINQNFTELQLYINDSSFSPIDLTNLYTDLSPADDNEYKLGSQTQRWKSLFLGSFAGTASDSLNGLWLGAAQIKGIGFTVDLPENSTIGGDLIIDPGKTYFKTVSVNGTAVEALDFNSVLTLNQGTGITLAGSALTESIEITNSGVTAISAGTAITIDQSTGNVTITNDGVQSLTNATTLPPGRAIGAGIAVNQANGNVAITNTGVLSVASGTGINVSTDTASGIATVNVGFSIPLAFRDIEVPGQDTLSADTVADTLRMESGYGIIITTSELITGVDTLNFALDQRIDIIGSVFADDSNKLVDAVEAKIVGDVENFSVSTDTVTTNNLAVNGLARIGEHWPFSDAAEDIGRVDNTYRNIYATALIGNVQGNITGDVKGSLFADDSSIIIDATENTVTANTVTAENLFGYHTGDVKGSVFGDDSTKIVDAVENKVFAEFFGNITGNVLGNVTGNVSGNVTGNAAGDHTGTFSGDVFSNLIDSADSSEINIVPSVNCNSDLTVGGNILPSTDLGGDLGSASQQWKSLYVSGSTIFLGGVAVRIENGTLSVDGSVFVNTTYVDNAIANLVSSVADDTTPQLGGDLDLNNFNIDGTGNINITGDITSTNITVTTVFAGTLDTVDSSAITVVPAVMFNSDVTVENELIVNNSATVSGTLNVATLNVTGTITSQGSGTPELFSDNEILLTAGTRVEISSSALKLASFNTEQRDSLNPVQGDVIYNTSTQEFQGYTNLLWKSLNVGIGNFAFSGNDIDSNDSSGITIIPSATFNSDVTVENELLVNNNATITGSVNISGDITGFTNITGSTGGTISGFTTLTGDGGGSISGFDDITVTTVFAGTIDTTDSSAITVVPVVTFNSDVTVENELFVSNSITAANFLGNVTATSVVTSALTLSAVKETVISKTGATSTVIHDFSEASVFYHTAISDNFTANFINLDIGNGQGTNISLILIQGVSAYIPNAVQINGAAQIINWEGSAEPSGNADKKDIVTFSIVRTADTYTLFGALTTFGV